MGNIHLTHIVIFTNELIKISHYIDPYAFLLYFKDLFVEFENQSVCGEVLPSASSFS